jgi:hypothetical protein
MPQPSKTNAASPRARFVVHQNAQGYWVASEKAGLVTGIFALQREALHFALCRLPSQAGSRASASPKPR